MTWEQTLDDMVPLTTDPGDPELDCVGSQEREDEDQDLVDLQGRNSVIRGRRCAGGANRCVPGQHRKTKGTEE